MIIAAPTSISLKEIICPRGQLGIILKRPFPWVRLVDQCLGNKIYDMQKTTGVARKTNEAGSELMQLPNHDIVIGCVVGSNAQYLGVGLALETEAMGYSAQTMNLL
jgi:hypothetical protein